MALLGELLHFPLPSISQFKEFVRRKKSKRVFLFILVRSYPHSYIQALSNFDFGQEDHRAKSKKNPTF